MRLSKQQQCRFLFRMATEVALVLCFVGFALGLCVLFAAIFFTLPEFASITSKSKDQNYCLQSECVVLAGTHLKGMDTTVNPCENFYKFVCGNYQEYNPRPENEFEVSEMTKIRDIVEYKLRRLVEAPPSKTEPRHHRSLKNFYRSCIDTKLIEKIGLTQIDAMLNELGGWPVVKDFDPQMTWQQLIYKIFDLGAKADFLLKMVSDINFEDTSKNILVLSAPEHFVKPFLKRGAKQMGIYYEFMVNVTLLFGANATTAKMEMGEVLQFEIELAKSSQEFTGSENAEEYFKVYTVGQLEENFPDFPWYDYLSRASGSNNTVSRQLEVAITELKYVSGLIRLLNRTSQRVVRNYLILCLIRELTKYLNKDLEDLNSNLFERALGAPEQLPRWTKCLKTTILSLDASASSIYVQKYFDLQTRAKATELYKNIWKTFRKTLTETRWPKEDREKVLKKFDRLYVVIGYPDELLNDTILHEFYDGLDFKPKQFLKSGLQLSMFQRRDMFDSLLRKFDRTDWKRYSNAFDDSHRGIFATNSIFFPAIVFDGRFFHDSVPQYINYGPIGSYMAFYVYQNFGNFGLQFDIDGNLRQWLSNATFDDFLEKQRCLEEKLDNFTYHGVHIKGDSMVVGNMAALGGIKTAYNGYKKWLLQNGEEKGLPGMNYTNKQMFWIAQVAYWCGTAKVELLDNILALKIEASKQYSVNAPLANLEAFGEDFNCPLGSKMNPLKKCSSL